MREFIDNLLRRWKRCPSDQALDLLSLGELPPSVCELLLAHIDRCGPCRRHLWRIRDRA